MNVALNIGVKNIKVVSINGRRVKKWAAAELPAGLVSDGLILQPKTVGDAVSALFKQTGIPRDRVIASVAGLSFTYRFITLPRMKPDQQEEAILRAARKEISIPLEDLYVSWQRLPDIGNELSFFILGVERNRIDAMVETLKTAGIEPYLMGLRPLALARIAERSDAIVVNMEEGCFDIVFMSGGIPRVIHTIAPRGTSATLEDNVRRLADELTKTAAFYQSSHPEALLGNTTPLLLTGDWAAEPTTMALLQTEVEYPVSRLMPQMEIPEGLPVDSYAAVIGLALKKSPPRTATKIEAANFVDVNINILAGKYRKPKAKPVPFSRVLLWIILIAAVALLYPLYQNWADTKNKNAILQTGITDIQRRINLTNSIIEDNKVIEGKIQTLTDATANITAAYQATLSKRGEFTANFELIASLVPTPAIFSDIEIKNTEIFVYGEADTVFTVTDFATALEKTGIFKEVRIDELAEASSAFSTGVTSNTTIPVPVITFTIVIQK